MGRAPSGEESPPAPEPLAPRRQGAAASRPEPRQGSGCPGGVGRGAGAQGLRESPRGRRDGTRAPWSWPPRGRRGGAAAALFPRALVSPAPSPGPSSVAPARVHAAPPATAARAWARGLAPRRPAAGAAAVARPPGDCGVRGAPGLRLATGRRDPAQNPAAGGARGAALPQLPRGFAQRPASAVRGAAGPRVGECGSNTAGARGDPPRTVWAVTPVRARLSAWPRVRDRD